MLSFIIRRLGASVIVLWGITILTFILAYAMPSDPARMIAGPHASQATLNQIRHNLGLDKPLPVQYMDYIGRLFHGNLGTSYIYNEPVLHLILTRLGPTAELALGCWLAELIIGIPLGVFTARRARRVSDYVLSAGALVGLSIPPFWLGLVLMYYLGFEVQIFPIGGNTGLLSLVLPSLTFGVTGAAIYMRLLKSSMLEVMNKDYIRTARAKGATESRITWRHTLRNSMIPVVTYAGIDIGYLLSGVVLIEYTFNWNGLGMLAVEAIQQSDIPVIMGTVLLTAALVVIFNLLVDIVYVFIDPRIRYS